MTVNPTDFIEICDLRYAYAEGIDTRDWALHRSIYLDRVTIDFSSYSGRPAAVMAADDWVAGLRPLFRGLVATQHTMTNPRVSVEDDTATLRMSMEAKHFLDHDDPSAWFTIGGYYTDSVRRTEGRWRIEGVTLTTTWRQGRPDIMITAAARGRTELGESTAS